MSEIDKELNAGRYLNEQKENTPVMRYLCKLFVECDLNFCHQDRMGNYVAHATNDDMSQYGRVPLVPYFNSNLKCVDCAEFGASNIGAEMEDGSEAIWCVKREANCMATSPACFAITLLNGVMS